MKCKHASVARIRPVARLDHLILVQIVCGNVAVSSRVTLQLPESRTQSPDSRYVSFTALSSFKPPKINTFLASERFRGPLSHCQSHETSCQIHAPRKLLTVWPVFPSLFTRFWHPSAFEPKTGGSDVVRTWL